MTLYMSLNIPSILMVIIGFRKDNIEYVDYSYLVTSEVLTKIGFGFVLLPWIYLIGFWKRQGSDNVYKSLGQIMFVIGHFLNMLFLSIINTLAKQEKDLKMCDKYDSLFMMIFMINPFTYSFFGSTLDYFICEKLS